MCALTVHTFYLSSWKKKTALTELLTINVIHWDGVLPFHGKGHDVEDAGSHEGIEDHQFQMGVVEDAVVVARIAVGESEPQGNGTQKGAHVRQGQRW